MTEKCCLHYFSECVRRTIKLRYEVSFTWPRPETLKHSKASSLPNRGKFLHCYIAIDFFSPRQFVHDSESEIKIEIGTADIVR